MSNQLNAFNTFLPPEAASSLKKSRRSNDATVTDGHDFSIVRTPEPQQNKQQFIYGGFKEEEDDKMISVEQ